QAEVRVPAADVQPALRGRLDGAHHGGAALVLGALGGEEALHLAAAETVVTVLVVEVEALRREPRVLEDVPAAAALVELEGARLVLDQVRGGEQAAELGRTAPAALVD